METITKRGSLIVPVLDEEAAIEKFLKALESDLFQRSEIQFEVIFVNDGSQDSTLDTLLALQIKDPRIIVVDLSRNWGKEAALTAGLATSKGDFVIPMDVDLQDPPSVVLEMIQKWQDGFEVVEARRSDRLLDSFGKRTLAGMYYKIHNAISEQKITENVGDFRLLDRQVVEALLTLPESQRFMKGMFSWVGFRKTVIDYSRTDRVAGKTKFRAAKLMSLGVQGLTSFSTAPLRIWTFVGLIVSLIAVFWALLVVARAVFLGIEAPGYASTIVAITVLGGLQLVGIGVLGEYLGKTYLEAKRRPSYIVRKVHRSK